MAESESVVIPVSGEQDILSVLRYAWHLAQSAALDPETCARLTAAAMSAASGASLGVEFSRVAGAERVLRIASVAGQDCVHRVEFPGAFSLPESSPESVREEVAGFAACVLTALDAERQASGKLQKAQDTVAALETELEETNRGVLALYAELDERAEKLRRADELKSRFLSYASHELRTPLNGIVALVRLLKARKSEQPPEELKQLSFIQQAAEEMREMVNDLLDLAKVEAGKVTIQPSEFGLEFVFGALRGIFRPLLQTDDVVLRFEDTSAVPAIYSDEAKVSQILRNFISNALKFTEHGEVRVWATTTDDFVRISVQDTGIGIAPHNVERIFEEYAQIDHPLQKRVRGTGLGLPLCRRFAELLGGHVEVESELGRGSTFTVVLPLKFTPESHSPAPRPFTPHTPASKQRPTVLIIDDADIDRYLIRQLLSASGEFQIIEAEDGPGGLELLLREKPDFVFLDLSLPKMDGTQVLSEIRAMPETRDTPVAIVTARNLSEQDHAELSLLATAIFDKATIAAARKLDLHLSVNPPTVNVLY